MVETISFEKKPHWDGPFNWIKFSFLVFGPFITAVIAVFYVRAEGFHFSDFLSFSILAAFTGFSVTAGYHRLFSHRTYKSHPAVKLFFLIFGAASFENSAYSWSSDHRYHHRFVDTDSDPYDAKKGFFWSHMGWIFYTEPADRTFDNVKDLERDPLVMWQKRWYWVLYAVFGLLFPMLIGFAFGRPGGGLLWGGFIRLYVILHCTYLINSGAHYFGTKPYSLGNTARDCWWLAIPSLGEGYHNFHHAFASDYRNGVSWWAFDPSKWLIFLLSHVGLTTHLQRVPEEALLRARADVKLETAKNLLGLHPEGTWKAMYRARLEEARARFNQAVSEWEGVNRRYVDWKNGSARTASRRERKIAQSTWRQEIRAYRGALAQAFADCQALCRGLPTLT